MFNIMSLHFPWHSVCELILTANRWFLMPLYCGQWLYYWEKDTKAWFKSLEILIYSLFVHLYAFLWAIFMFVFSSSVLHWIIMLGAKLHAGRSFQGNSCSTTCPSFCMSVQRSSTSVPHWPAACTHAWAYCPATELCRLRGHSGKDKKSHTDLCRPWEHDLCGDTTREGWGKWE